MNQNQLRQLTQQAYDEAHALREQPGMGEVVGRMTLLYGPPQLHPDLALVSFQGGAEDPSPSLRTWPPRLRYLEQSLSVRSQATGPFRRCRIIERARIGHGGARGGLSGSSGSGRG